MAMTEAQKQLKAYQSQVTENEVKNDCRDLLLRLGWLVIRVNSGGVKGENETTGKKRYIWFVIWQILGMVAQRAGVSDILAVQPPFGRFWAIECKKPGKLANTTPLQRNFQAAVRAAGGIAVVVDDVELLRAEIAKERTKGL
jgi:hypothetical protein